MLNRKKSLKLIQFSFYYIILNQKGFYTLIAAKLNRKVVSIESSIDKFKRLHKAARQNKIESNIVLVNREISIATNYSSATQISNELPKRSQPKQRQDSINAIDLDDIVDYLPKREDESKFKKAMIRIEIGGLEPLAFRRARKLFDKLDIRVVLMNWQCEKHDELTKKHLNEAIEFFASQNYRPHLLDIPLDINDYMRWSFLVKWIKQV